MFSNFYQCLSIYSDFYPYLRSSSISCSLVVWPRDLTTSPISFIHCKCHRYFHKLRHFKHILRLTLNKLYLLPAFSVRANRKYVSCLYGDKSIMVLVKCFKSWLNLINLRLCQFFCHGLYISVKAAEDFLTTNHR